jgi:hypothetical protein
MVEVSPEIEQPKPTGRIVYNLAMAKALRNIKPPYKGLVVDIRTRPNYLALVVYEENIMEYESEQRMNIMEYLLMMRSIIESYNVRCEIEGAKGSARRSGKS